MLEGIRNIGITFATYRMARNNGYDEVTQMLGM